MSCSNKVESHNSTVSSLRDLFGSVGDIDFRTDITFEFRLQGSNTYADLILFSSKTFQFYFDNDGLLWFVSEARNPGVQIRVPVTNSNKFSDSNSIILKIEKGSIFRSTTNGMLFSNFDARPLNPILSGDKLMVSGVLMSQFSNNSICVTVSRSSTSSSYRPGIQVIILVLFILSLLILNFNYLVSKFTSSEASP